jgi:hypothetical protein
MTDRTWKYGLQIFGVESVIDSMFAGHRSRMVMIEYQVINLEVLAVCVFW